MSSGQIPVHPLTTPSLRIEQEVCAWYHNAKRVLLWNLLPKTRHVTVSYRGRQQQAELGPLGSVVLDGFPW
jgi:hypothetical protein